MCGGCVKWANCMTLFKCPSTRLDFLWRTCGHFRFFKLACIASRNENMPRIQRSHGAAVIEVSIPLSVTRGGDAESDDDDSCFICAHSFCHAETCLRSATHLRCCSQAICCGCITRLAKRCKCQEECEAVIAFCPFCREMAPLGAIDVFLGTRDTCKVCEALTARAAATPPPTENTPPTTPLQLQTE